MPQTAATRTVALRPLVASGLNNAGLASVSTYQELVPAFERLLRQSNGSCLVLRTLPRIGPPAFRGKHAQLQLLMTPSS